ncbi:MAG: SUMF1/EgtB/PvdO family nonheme iron enzyme [Polyangiaceae bacterium]
MDRRPSSVLFLALGLVACDPAAAIGARALHGASPERRDRAAPPSVPGTVTRASAPPAERSADRVDGPCPPSMVQVKRTCIDAFEAHLVSDAGGEARVHPHFERPEAGVRYRAVAARGVRYRAVAARGVFPQGYISQVEAADACAASGKRLCSKREWQSACRGQGRFQYPYGPRRTPGKCNSMKQHLFNVLFPDVSPQALQYDKHFNDPALDKMEGWLAPSGAYEDCRTELGVYDMVGNLHEWVSDRVTKELVDTMKMEEVARHDQPWAVGNGVFMGGFFSTTSELGPGCMYITVAHDPGYHDYSTGFRCCQDAALGPSSPSPGRSREARRSAAPL